MVGTAIGNRFLATARLGLKPVMRKQEDRDMVVSCLATLKESQVESSLLTALTSMEGLFLSLCNNGKLHSASIGRPSCSKMVEGDGGASAHACYQDFINVLLELITKAGVTHTVHAKILRTLMEFVRTENSGVFNVALYEKIVRALVMGKGPSMSVAGVLESEYFQYSDVRYHTTVNVQKFADEWAAMGLANNLKPDSLQTFAGMLSKFPATLNGDSVEKTWCSTSVQAKCEMSVEMNCDAIQKFKDLSIQKESFLSSWRSFTNESELLNDGDMVSRVLFKGKSSATAAPDSFVTSLADEVEERVVELASCKETAAEDFPVKGFQCGRSVESNGWMASAARGKEDDDDDDDDDEEDDDDYEEEDDEDAKEVGGEEDIEGEEGEDEEDDDDGEADENGEDDDGEEGEDDDDGDEEEGEEEEEDDEDHDEDDDDDDEEGESDDEVEPPKKKRK